MIIRKLARLNRPRSSKRSYTFQRSSTTDRCCALRTRGKESPVHKSGYNPQDKEDIISVRIQPKDGSAAYTHHVYANGTGTFKKGDKREYSTTAGRRE